MNARESRQVGIFVLLVLAAAGLGMAWRHLAGRRQPAPPGEITLNRQAFEPATRSAADANGQATHVSLEMLRQMLETRSAIVVDARRSALFRKGHVPGAINLPAVRPDDDTVRGILAYGQHVPVVVYCESDNCDDSKTVAALLSQKGMTSVRTFPGGWQQWQDHDLPTESDG